MKYYDELIKLETFSERREYLYIGDHVAHTTFGNARWVNQRLYGSPEWKRTRDQIIIRDNGCDLGIEGCDLGRRNILVHHINPITEDDIVNMRPCVFDHNNLISTSLDTHNYIHFGIKLDKLSFDRAPNDTCPWKR